MGFPHTELWYPPTWPTIPSGWNNPSGFFATSISTFGGAFTAGPLSAPNVLALLAGSGGPSAITYSSIDTNSGNVSVTGAVLCDVAFALRSASIFWRCNSSTLTIGGTDYYEARLDWYAGTLVWYSQLGGTTNAIATVSSITTTANTWYLIGATSVGTSTSITLQRTSDSKYWYSGAWNTAPGNAISGTDGAVTGAGCAGYIGTAGLSSDILFANWTFGPATGGATLNAAVGSYSLTGLAATLLHSPVLHATAGAYAVTGAAAEIFEPYTLSASAGSYSLTGLSAGLYYGHEIAASPGAYAVTGEAASLYSSGFLVATAGSYAISRIPAELLYDRVLDALPGSYVLSGQPAAFEQPYTLTAQAGTYSVTGAAATLAQGYLLSAAEGTYAITGAAATLTVTVPGGGVGPLAYHVYANSGIADPIDYDAPIATTSNTTYTTSPLTVPGTWSFGVRAFNSEGEELNLDLAVTIVLNAAGQDISDVPMPPVMLRALAYAGGTVKVEWIYVTASGPRSPTGFHVYIGTGGTPNYTMPATVTVPGLLGNLTVIPSNVGRTGSFEATLSGLTGGTVYTIGVRAFNGIGEEKNTKTVNVTADAAGPAAVDDLVGVAT